MKTEISLASKDTLKYTNKCSDCTNIHNNLTTLNTLAHPHAHTPAQTQNTQSPPAHTDPPSMQAVRIQLQSGHQVRGASSPFQPSIINALCIVKFAFIVLLCAVHGR